MNEPILVILAAGMGSRYGGLKQMDPVGPSGEAILDYSVFDARRAGFKRVIFIIKHEIEADFKRMVGSRIEKYMEVTYAFQQLDMLPEGCGVPEGRVKPWGTGHAVLCCREYIDAPFLVINADDYYGVEAYRIAYDKLSKLADDDKARYFMVGYELRNTLTENGYVSRGVCSTDENACLTTVTERTHIIGTCDGPMYTEDGDTYHRLPADAPVSMNMFGFTPSIIKEMEATFPAFHQRALAENPMKAEFYLPGVVNGMLEKGTASVEVLRCPSRWYGVTYQEDKPQVKAALAQMAKDGLYPTPLWQ
ncbi:MAG: NTP transferase domain-containing protein [Clostridiales bacterium]|nr:NTP transferase domain-containing protein [Clostridiales bacterium]